MFKANDNQEKLENMNIDDVLEHAEDHDTTENLGGAQLGGEDFLRQFEIADYKADVSWDDIIPKEERERIEEEDRVLAEQKATEELIAMHSRRVAALSKRLNPGDTESIEDDEPEKKRRKPTKKAVVKKTKPRIDLDRELDVNDIRHLYNGMRRYGDLEARYQEIVSGTELSKLNEENVRQTGEQLYQACLQAIKDHNAEKVDGAPAPAQVTTDTPPTNNEEGKPKPAPAKNKAVLIEFKGLAKVNAESILQRRDDMTFLRRILHRTTPLANFRIASQVKAVQNWKCQWAAKEDAMLLVGVDKHGHGNWYAIRDDPELGLTEKLFLDENKSEKKGAKTEGASKDIPGSIHLNRRADYLISVLREEHQKPGILDVLSGKTVDTPAKEAKQRPRGESMANHPSRKSMSGDTPSSVEKKRHPYGAKDGEGSSTSKKSSAVREPKKADDRAVKKHINEDGLSEYESMDEGELKVSVPT